MPTRRAAIYVRISDDREGSGLGVARQEDDCRKLAARRGWDVAEVYCDNDVSAYDRRKTRKDWRRLLGDLKAGQVDAVVAWHPDRLYRQTRDLLELMDLCERKRVDVDTVTAGTVDLSTPTGRAVAKTVAAWNEHESEHKAERNRRKAEELARAGKVGGGGTRPYGYASDRLTLEPREAQIVRECAARILAGESLRGVVTDLNARGVPTVTGKAWQAQTLRRLLTSARISGQREHTPVRESDGKRLPGRGVIVSDAVWPAIISKGDTARLRRLLADPNRAPAAPARRYMLTGLLTCERCGHPLVGRPRDDHRPRYVCQLRPGTTRCGGTYVLAEPTDEYVVGLVTATLECSDLLAELRRAEQATGDEELLREMEADELFLSELADDLGQRRISRAEFFAAREPAARRLERTRSALATRRRSTALDGLAGEGVLTAAWPQKTLDQRRAILSAVLQEVRVRPAVRGRNRFDVSRFQPVWRA